EGFYVCEAVCFGVAFVVKHDDKAAAAIGRLFKVGIAVASEGLRPVAVAALVRAEINKVFRHVLCVSVVGLVIDHLKAVRKLVRLALRSESDFLKKCLVRLSAR